MQVVSFINMKGGVGKTTLSVNVAYGLAYHHAKRVLLVDNDPQFNASQYLMDDDEYFEHTRDTKKGTIRDIFLPNREGPLRTVPGKAKAINKARMPLSACSVSIYDGGSGRGKLDLIPSTLNLMEIETSSRGTEQRLRSYLQTHASHYDYVIIDCPPTTSIFTQSAILASDKYLVPIKPDPLSVIGLPLLEKWLETFCETYGLELENVGIVFTLVRSTTTMDEVMAEMTDKRGDDVFPCFLSQATAVARSVNARTPVFRHANGKSSVQINAITEEFLRRTSGD